ncbi:MAG: hypothetical protein HQK92_09965, partial [Nitrospirae bacterium]|nr:hypothetical protein [Nitrospirota bacterium]
AGDAAGAAASGDAAGAAGAGDAAGVASADGAGAVDAAGVGAGACLHPVKPATDNTKDSTNTK